MEITIQIALISAVLTFFAAVLATIVNFYRERSENLRWQRTLQLEERRVKQEENKWLLELNSQREMELHKIRINTYPELFTTLSELSRHNVHKLTEDRMLELADKINKYGYGDAGLCMLTDTREAIFALRRSLVKLADKEIDIEEIIGPNGTCTKLVELMRRDLSHNWSLFVEFKSLTELNREGIQKTLMN